MNYNFQIGRSFTEEPQKYNSIPHAPEPIKISNRRDILINWVNSLEYPNCLLASDMHDFMNGVIFCEIVNEIILHNQKPDFLPKIKINQPNYEESIRNATMALTELKSMRTLNLPSHIANLKETDILTDENKILSLLDYLYSVATRSSGTPKDGPAEIHVKLDQLEKDYNSGSGYWSTYNSSTNLMNSSLKEQPGSSTTKPPLNPTSAKKTSRSCTHQQQCQY
jgi:hypothetical protein